MTVPMLKECMKALNLRRRHGGSRQRDIEVSLGGVLFKRAGRIHGGEGGRAHEGRRFFDNGANVRRDGDDVVAADEADQASEGRSESRNQLIGSRMHAAELFKHGVGIFAGSSSLATCLKCCLIFTQIGPANFKQLVEGQIDHLVIMQLL